MYQVHLTLPVQPHVWLPNLGCYSKSQNSSQKKPGCHSSPQPIWSITCHNLFSCFQKHLSASLCCRTCWVFSFKHPLSYLVSAITSYPASPAPVLFLRKEIHVVTPSLWIQGLCLLVVHTSVMSLLWFVAHLPSLFFSPRAAFCCYCCCYLRSR